MLPKTYESKLFTFKQGSDDYDGKSLSYSIDKKSFLQYLIDLCLFIFHQ